MSNISCSNQLQPFGFMIPAISDPSTEYLDQYINQANQYGTYLQDQLAMKCAENQNLRSALISEVNKTILHEYGKEFGEFSGFFFFTDRDGSPYVEFRNTAGQSVTKLLSDDRHFSVLTEESLSKDGCHRTIHVGFLNRNGERKSFAVSEDNFEKKVYSAYCNAGGLMRYGKNKKVAAYLFENFINWLRQSSAVSFDSDCLWSKFENGWICTANTKVLRLPMLTSIQGNPSEMILDLIRVYGFLESRIDEIYRIRKIFNFVDTKRSLSPDLSLASKEKELLKALETKLPVLFIHASEPGAAASFYTTQLARNNFDMICSSVFNGRKSLPVLVTDDFTTLSPKCLIIEYSESENHPQNSGTLAQLADAIVKNPAAFNKVFSDAFEKSLKSGDPDTVFRSEAATLYAVSSVIKWYYFIIGEEKTAEKLNEAFNEAISFHAAKWENFDAQDLGEEIRIAIRNAVSNGDLNLLDRLCVPANVDISRCAFYDPNSLFIPESVFIGILAKKLPYYGWYTIRQYLDKAGELLRNGERWTSKVSVKLDTGAWIQKRCLSLRLSFINPSGMSSIINLRRNEHGKQ